jgi:hypothetical protein
MSSHHYEGNTGQEYLADKFFSGSLDVFGAKWSWQKWRSGKKSWCCCIRSAKDRGAGRHIYVPCPNLITLTRQSNNNVRGPRQSSNKDILQKSSHSNVTIQLQLVESTYSEINPGMKAARKVPQLPFGKESIYLIRTSNQVDISDHTRYPDFSAVRNSDLSLQWKWLSLGPSLTQWGFWNMALRLTSWCNDQNMSFKASKETV